MKWHTRLKHECVCECVRQTQTDNVWRKGAGVCITSESCAGHRSPLYLRVCVNQILVEKSPVVASRQQCLSLLCWILVKQVFVGLRFSSDALLHSLFSSIFSYFLSFSVLSPSALEEKTPVWVGIGGPVWGICKLWVNLKLKITLKRHFLECN